ncbi:helix-turn-helix transcriptional regulator [Nonomuraea sp. MCN248]|uniref:Helix-turn-helix transcriptional regulator n=1 Tax=Nonomuraea corallina TaxID=2989783 RepID=A0ABT4SE96_9ACTN|nr:helix-turn-helix transcriptional regulator [Nonomuraea corallina]MDA0635521.1 helix-turn-helix transcriptional regulator [Nonomuraea corallina]
MSGGTQDRALGAMLRRWRERALLTQEDVAERSGLSVRTVRRLEGGGLPRARSTSLRLLGEALGLDHAERERMAAVAHGAARVTGKDQPSPAAQAPERGERARTHDGLVRAHEALGQAEHACRNGREVLKALLADSLPSTPENRR